MTRINGSAKAVMLSSGDNVAVLLSHARQGDAVRVLGASFSGDTVARSDTPQFHKIALSRIAEGQDVMRCETVIGTATREIAAGDWVHTHNLRSLRAKRSDNGGSE